MKGISAVFVFCLLAGIRGGLLADISESDTTETIDAALSAATSQDVAAGIATLRAAADKVEQVIPNNVVVADLLSLAKNSAEEAQRQGHLKNALETLSRSLEVTREIVRFKIVDEGPLPKGFPAPGPVGELQVRHYPVYRMARATSKADSAFWTLFRHIQKNNIAMTAPVEMTYRQAEDRTVEQVDMAFLYRNAEQGTLGADGKVAVQNVAPVTVIGLGLRGSSGDRQIAAARQYLDRWLASHSQEYQPAGELRVLGYNSPMVPTKRRYFAVEIPIEPAHGQTK